MTILKGGVPGQSFVAEPWMLFSWQNAKCEPMLDQWGFM